jgi:hypothetical protein
MLNTWAAKTATIVTTGLAIAIATAGPAASANADQPTRWCGAQNMIVASPYFTDMFGGGTTVSDGMDVAMTRNAAEGNAGMFIAVGNSFAHAGGPTCP